MGKKCDLCEGVARMYCESDQASLCWHCDAKVHGANFLVAKHARCLLCSACQSPTPWKATGLRLGPTFSVCDSCVALKSAAGGRDGVSSTERIQTESPGQEINVVPWAAAGQPLPVVSSSSSDGGGGGPVAKRKRECYDEEIGCSSAQESNCSRPLKRPTREEPVFKSTAAVNSIIRLEGESLRNIERRR
ncbi:B-box type zinc finger family protein [Raphanus sativus]|nr:B-box type zinc finger family protein [Raphanus sativus]